MLGTMASIGAQFGEQLRGERERRGLSLETLCSRTKVNLRHLEALERGDYKSLPGGVFRRGFVRAYVDSLGLDESDWLPRFDASYAAYVRSTGLKLEPADDAWVTFAANVKKNRGTSRRSTLKQWLGVMFLLLLLFAAGWAVWRLLLAARVKNAVKQTNVSWLSPRSPMLFAVSKSAILTEDSI